jgi:hypothetical protein
VSLGYFKVWRQLEDSDLWRTDPLTIKIWLWILMHACHKEQRLPHLILQPGELLTTYAEVMKAMVVPGHGFRKRFAPSLQTVRTSMQALCELYVISKQQAPQQGGLHVKVLHWADYQSTEEGSATDHVTDISTDLQQTSNTIQECKNEKNEGKREDSGFSFDSLLFDETLKSAAAPKMEKAGEEKKPSPTAQRIVAAFVDAHALPPDRNRIGRFAKKVKEELDRGVIPATILTSVAQRMGERGLGPGLFGDVVAEFGAKAARRNGDRIDETEDQHRRHVQMAQEWIREGDGDPFWLEHIRTTLGEVVYGEVKDYKPVYREV